MEKRRIIFADYDTAVNGWTLTGWVLSRAKPKTSYIEKPNGDGSWDLSTALSDGLIKYKDRQLTATFETSEGTRSEREAAIRNMINTLDGVKLQIELPDDPDHYIVGRLEIEREYNDLAHAAVTVTAVCEPWKYAKEENIYTFDLSAVTNMIFIENRGRRVIIPDLILEGTSPSVLLEYAGQSVSFSAGEYKWPALLLTPGMHALNYSGSGKLTVKFREAVLE